MFKNSNKTLQDITPPRITNPEATPAQPQKNERDNGYSNFNREEVLFGHHVPRQQETVKGRFGGFKKWLKSLSKKQKIGIVLGFVLTITLLTFATWWFVLRAAPTPPPAPAVVEEPEEEPEPTVVPSKLTGLPVAPEVNERQVTGVIIENSPEARPQSGLYQAGIVYEAIAEAGITRFVALYQDTSSEYIGPVRSVRPYFLDFILPFDATIAHVGGSPQALEQIPQLGVKTIGQFQNAGAYGRIPTRYAPHNMYTDSARLRAAEKERGFTKSQFDGFLRKEEAKPLGTSKATTIDLRYSSAMYNVQFKYDKESNSYQRFMAGRPHIDERANKQISPTVVVALVMNRGVMANGIHTTYQTTGSGTMYVFQDGDVIKGTWEKPSRKAQFTFKNSEGKKIELTPGKTWVGIVDNAGAVSHKLDE